MRMWSDSPGRPCSNIRVFHILSMMVYGSKTYHRSSNPVSACSLASTRHSLKQNVWGERLKIKFWNIWIVWFGWQLMSFYKAYGNAWHNGVKKHEAVTCSSRSLSGGTSPHLAVIIPQHSNGPNPHSPIIMGHQRLAHRFNKYWHAPGEGAGWNKHPWNDLAKVSRN